MGQEEECLIDGTWDQLNFLAVFLTDIFTSPILGPLVSLFCTSGDVLSKFQSQSGFCLNGIAELNVMYIP